MDGRNLPPLSRLLVTPSGPPPTPADLAVLMRRLRVDQRWSETAVEQLIRAAAAADRWLTTHPEQAARLVEDPAGAVEAMRDAGLLTGAVDDLLAILRALGREADAEGRRAPGIDPGTVRVGAKPALRSPYRRASAPGEDRRPPPSARAGETPP